MKSFKSRLRTQLLKESPERPRYDDGQTGDKAIRQELEKAGQRPNALDTDGQLFDSDESFGSLKDQISEKASDFAKLVIDLAGPFPTGMAPDEMGEAPDTGLLQKIAKLSGSASAPESLRKKGVKMLDEISKATKALFSSYMVLQTTLSELDIPIDGGVSPEPESMPAPMGPIGPSPV